MIIMFSFFFLQYEMNEEKKRGEVNREEEDERKEKLRIYLRSAYEWLNEQNILLMMIKLLIVMTTMMIMMIADEDDYEDGVRRMMMPIPSSSSSSCLNFMHKSKMSEYISPMCVCVLSPCHVPFVRREKRMSKVLTVHESWRSCLMMLQLRVTGSSSSWSSFLARVEGKIKLNTWSVMMMIFFGWSSS